jgi:hypothetical protein
MENKKSKPYFIEVYTAPGALKNKYKFVLEATTVQQLKALVKEKLIAKKELENDTPFALKDADDFELASDDEVEDVVPDSKLRIYPHNSQPVAVPPVVVVQSLPPQQPGVVPSVVSVPAPAAGTEDKLVAKNGILDISKLTIPILPPETKHRLHLRCPQIRKTVIELPFEPSLDSYLDLSRYIVSALGLQPQLKVLLYNKKGQPFFYNLDLMHQRLPKLDLSE